MSIFATATASTSDSFNAVIDCMRLEIRCLRNNLRQRVIDEDEIDRLRLRVAELEGDKAFLLRKAYPVAG